MDMRLSTLALWGSAGFEHPTLLHPAHLDAIEALASCLVLGEHLQHHQHAPHRITVCVELVACCRGPLPLARLEASRSFAAKKPSNRPGPELTVLSGLGAENMRI